MRVTRFLVKSITAIVGGAIVLTLPWLPSRSWSQSSGEPASGPEISVPKRPATTTAPVLPPRNWIDQSQLEVDQKSRGCIECHAGIEPMHQSPSVMLGCVDCHGGDPTPGLTQRKAHVSPRNPVFWETSANPSDSSVLLNHESAEFIRFVNPGDLRVAEKA